MTENPDKLNVHPVLTIRPAKGFFIFFVAVYIGFIAILFFAKGTNATKIEVGIGFSLLMLFLLWGFAKKYVIKLTGSGLSIDNANTFDHPTHKLWNTTVTVPIENIQTIKINNILIEVVDKAQTRYVMGLGPFNKQQLLKLKTALEAYGVSVVFEL